MAYFLGFLVFAMIDIGISFIGGTEFTLEEEQGNVAGYILEMVAIVISGVLFLILSPICYIQVTNKINFITTSVRFSKNSSLTSENSVFSESNFLLE